jgi:hypothetical protein
MKLFCVLAFATLASSAFGADSVVVGRAISNTYSAGLPCGENEICLDSIYLWVIDPAKALAGPKINGRLTAETYQHVGVNRHYLRSLRLFVLRPLTEIRDALRASDAKYYLVASSPIYKDGSYCISVDPTELGLALKNVRTGSDGTFCFDHKQVE